MVYMKDKIIVLRLLFAFKFSKNVAMFLLTFKKRNNLQKPNGVL